MDDIHDDDPICFLTATDAGDAWSTIKTEIQEPVSLGRWLGSASAAVKFVDDVRYRGLDLPSLLLALPADFCDSYILVVDNYAIADPEHSILVVDLWENRGRTFRALPSTICGIESNFRIANCDFEDFLNAADDGGVFRGHE